MTGPTVVVIGAGVLGASTALHLARLGSAVTLVTEGDPASGASGRSLSWLNSAGPRSDAYHRLRTTGIDRYRTLLAQTGRTDVLRFDGGLTWAAPGESMRERHEHERRIGYDSVWLRPEDVAHRVPGVDASAVHPEGAVLNPGEGWVDLPRLVGYLVGELVASGGTVRIGAGRCLPDLRDGHVVGVTTADGTHLSADAVVLATGPWVPRDLAELGVLVPDRTPIALLVRTAPVATALRVVLNTPRVAVRPAPDGSLVFDADWSEREVEVLEDGRYAVRDETVAGLVAAARRVLAGAPDLVVTGVGVGPKPIPADGEPVVGTVPGVDGLHVLFTHSGATLGLVLGELTAWEVVHGAQHPLLASFRVGRFTDASGVDRAAP